MASGSCRAASSFLAGEKPDPPRASAELKPEALQLFAEGVELYDAGRAKEALEVWRWALAVDPDNFLIRSQIWVFEHPEHFYPTVDRDWQQLQLVKEGYDKPLP